ncbi:MAG: hypothetical protein WCG53_04080 [Actinomycetes bacterium]
MRKGILFVAMIFLLSPTNPAEAVTGTHGEILSVSKTSAIASGDVLSVTGKNFDQSVGVYVAMCKIVPTAVLPSPCGGGADKTGKQGASYWISSNPPSYGRGLTIPFKAHGSFSISLKVSPMIGTADCRKTPCAVYVRADHTRTQDRTHDLYVPIFFSK